MSKLNTSAVKCEARPCGWMHKGGTGQDRVIVITTWRRDAILVASRQASMAAEWLCNGLPRGWAAGQALRRTAPRDRHTAEKQHAASGAS